MNTLKDQIDNECISESIAELKRDISRNARSINELERKITINKRDGGLQNKTLGKQIRENKLNKI